MARVIALVLSAGLCYTMALKVDPVQLREDDKSEESSISPAHPGLRRQMAISAGVGAAVGGVGGFVLPRGAQSTQPVIGGVVSGTVMGAAASAATGLLNAANGGSVVAGVAGTGLGATLGAGLGTVAAYDKMLKLTADARKCTKILFPSPFYWDDYLGTWHTQYQNEETHQKAGALNCTSATWDRTQGLHEVRVTNSAMKSNGKIEHTKAFCADQQDGAKLVVGRCWLPKQSGAPHWVAYFNKGDGTAIIIGGQPNKYNSTTGKCGYQMPSQNGMWIVSRRRNADMAKIEALKTYMSDTLNLDTSSLVQIPQTQCVS